MDLQTQSRETLGKTAQLRKKGFIPAELYGRNVKNMHLAVSEKEFVKAYKTAGENTIISLHVGTEKRPVLIYDVQRDPILHTFNHVDFYQVKMDETIETAIPLSFIGEAPAVKAFGGTLVKSLMELPIESLPGDLPHGLTIDLSVLDALDKTIYVKDIALPKGVKAKVSGETPIASVTLQKVEEEVPVAPAVEDVKVETEEKKAERDAKKTETTEKE